MTPDLRDIGRSLPRAPRRKAHWRRCAGQESASTPPPLPWDRAGEDRPLRALEQREKALLRDWRVFWAMLAAAGVLAAMGWR